jgi:hypothetical protein
LQATNAVVLRFDSEAKKDQWKQAMQNALYRASAPAAVTILSGDTSSSSEFDDESQTGHESSLGEGAPSTPEGKVVEAARADSGDREDLNPAVQQNILVVGVLDVLRVDVEGAKEGGAEFALLQVRASGTRVELVQRMYDVAVGMVLQSVEVEDLAHGHTAPECRFLARSFLAAREDLDRSKSEEAEALQRLEKDSGWGLVDDEGGSPKAEKRVERKSKDAENEVTEGEKGDVAKSERREGGLASSEKKTKQRDTADAGRKANKEQGEGSRGVEKQGSTNDALQSPRSPKEGSPEVEMLDGDDFYDAASSLSRSDSARSRSSRSLGFRTVSSLGSVYFDAPEGTGSPPPQQGLEMLPPSFKQSGILELEEEEAGQDNVTKGNTFVKIVAVMRQTQSPDYKGVDTKVVLDMATLDFFLNRPTVLALMDFAQHITAPPEKAAASREDKGKQKEEQTEEGGSKAGEADGGDGGPSSEEDESESKMKGTVVSKIEPEALDESAHSEQPAVLSGLLGHGKSRVVFGLEVRMQRVQVVLNQDQGGTPLAVLAMLDLSNEVQVFPSSFSVKAGLGSLRICDSRLGEGHPYGEMFGMQKQTGVSFASLHFESYDPGEDEYSGYGYSLCVRLAAVRTVVLYRFIQEITAYFVDLAPAGGVVETAQIRETVAGVEHWIQQSDVKGQPAISLDVQIEKPLIVMPESSDSREYIELDIERVALSNEAQWKGGGQEDMAAVRLDVITLSIQGLGLRVGGEKGVGHEIVEEASGLQVGNPELDGRKCSNRIGHFPERVIEDANRGGSFFIC